MPKLRSFTSPGKSLGRSAVYAGSAMVATSHPMATAVGLQILTGGGNATDAAIAAAAVLAIAEPNMTGIGGDCFALISPDGSTNIEALNASGRAPAAIDIDAVRAIAAGGEDIPQCTPHAVTIPGAVAGWWALHERHGRMDWDKILAPACAYAAEGIAVHDRVAASWQENAALLAQDSDTARLFLHSGMAYGVGEVFRNPQLGEALALIRKHGRDGFYKGAVMEDMLGKLQSLGGAHSEADFADAGAEFTAPIRAGYKDHCIWECPPNGQGLAALIQLRLLDGFTLADMDATARMHILAETGRMAYHYRDRYIADPDFADVPVSSLLADAHIESLRAMIDPGRAAHYAAGDFPAHPDTVYLAVVDADGMAVSFINSLFDAFGSAITSPRYGVLFQSRGRGFRLAKGHPNIMAGGKRPFHTLIPGMLTRGDTLIGPFGVMGGQYQAQGHAMLMAHILDCGLDPQAALETPRGLALDGVLQLEAGVGADTARALAAMGHRIEYPAPVAIGGGQAILRDLASGMLVAGSDPRKDGMAAGY